MGIIDGRGISVIPMKRKIVKSGRVMSESDIEQERRQAQIEMLEYLHKEIPKRGGCFDSLAGKILIKLRKARKKDMDVD